MSRRELMLKGGLGAAALTGLGSVAAPLAAFNNSTSCIFRLFYISRFSSCYLFNIGNP